jgi:septal ring factor EnvC (AmiA/AmiB activator)
VMPASVLLIASLGFAGLFGGPRPVHPLTCVAEEPSFLRSWQPDAAGARVAGHVVALASENARTSEPGAIQIATATLAASESIDDVRDLLRGFLIPADPFFRRAGALPSPVSGRPCARFGPRERRGSATADRHTGYSYAVEPGTEVRTIASGYVSFSGPIRGLGLVVIVDHGEEYHSVYAHLLSTALERGGLVVSEERVGLGGGLATSGRTEVYFEIRDRGVPVNPAEWLR